MDPIANAAKNALGTCPRSAWSPTLVHGSRGENLSVETIKAQFLDDAKKARATVFTALVEWGLTGKWPKFQKGSVFFVRLILEWSTTRRHIPPGNPFPNEPPPWVSSSAATFLDRTALSWYSFEAENWARELAFENFECQERINNLLDPDD